MNQERIYKVLLGPHISEKATVVAEEHGQYVFRVATDATKLEIKKAVELLFEVSVDAVRTSVVKGKTKRTKFGMGKRSNWKKAYVSLAQGQEIDFADAE
ncbi:50S ribosomal protein L23 [Endozoicomonas sp. OPT23]|uniref:50S ribosomal protein L23 n=1 Tax=Endozoicomonas sp. OPT23 TaxID=2072845 RepID=UPI00129B69C7|nr:50S ribosomal protein L23 [Endozoicomonas sp. OPT23]MRI32975.1 50S ribosomal protein L23 [Endozoicomonas sp. OPT23]